jgi:hypothetical protein
VLDLFDEFRALVGALEAAGVEYAVCGGLAGSGQDRDDIRALEGEGDEP